LVSSGAGIVLEGNFARGSELEARISEAGGSHLHESVTNPAPLQHWQIGSTTLFKPFS
jgi:hypothetical protein